MTASELQSLFVTDLVRRNSGDRRRWRLIVGDVKVYSLATLADRLREDHPIITAG